MLQVPPGLDRLGEPVVTGYRSSFFRHSCSKAGCYIDQLPCWDELIECFPRKIRPTDVDGFVEMNGQFLFLEEKQAGAGPDEGQRRALKFLATLPGVTVAFFRPGQSSDYEVLIFDGTPPDGWLPFSEVHWFAWLRRWAIHADALQRAG